MGGRFDRIDDSQNQLEARLRRVEGFVSTEIGKQAMRKDTSTGRLQWVGIALAVAVLFVALPASVIAIIHLAFVLGV